MRRADLILRLTGDGGLLRRLPTKSPELTDAEGAELAALEQRLGRVHVRQRLGLERDFEMHIFRKGTYFFHVENWASAGGLIRGVLRVTGLHARGRRNALAIMTRE